jgi:hypothetical protein
MRPTSATGSKSAIRPLNAMSGLPPASGPPHLVAVGPEMPTPDPPWHRGARSVAGRPVATARQPSDTQAPRRSEKFHRVNDGLLSPRLSLLALSYRRKSRRPPVHRPSILWLLTIKPIQGRVTFGSVKLIYFPTSFVVSSRCASMSPLRSPLSQSNRI